jgi:hypothetical protein
VIKQWCPCEVALAHAPALERCDGDEFGVDMPPAKASTGKDVATIGRRIPTATVEKPVEKAVGKRRRPRQRLLSTG